MPRDRAADAQKNRLKPWQTKRFCIPEADHARFVAHLENILDVYQEVYDSTHPLICMDEASNRGFFTAAYERLACNGTWLLRSESAWLEYLNCLSPLGPITQ